MNAGGKKPITILATLLFHNFKQCLLSYTFSVVVLPLNYLITAIPHGALDSPHSLWVFLDLMWLLVVQFYRCLLSHNRVQTSQQQRFLWQTIDHVSLFSLPPCSLHLSNLFTNLLALFSTVLKHAYRLSSLFFLIFQLFLLSWKVLTMHEKLLQVKRGFCT